MLFRRVWGCGEAVLGGAGVLEGLGKKNDPVKPVYFGNDCEVNFVAPKDNGDNDTGNEEGSGKNTRKNSNH